MSKHTEAIREALAAGPTPGPWYLRTNRHTTTDGRAWGWLDTKPPGGSQYAPPGLQITWERGSKSEANAAYIAACNPVNVAALLAERDALRIALDELAAVVRGECPSLLDEDSGGSARLSMAIDAALAAQERT